MAQDNSAVVAQLYRNILGREPDAAGLAMFVSTMAAGLTVQAVEAAIAGSPEAAAQVAGLYQSVLGRAPDAGGLAAQVAGLATGATLTGERAGMAASAEAHSVIEGMYLAILGRAGDAGGVSAQQTALENGVPLAAVRAGMAGSAEAQADLQALYADLLGRSADPAGLAAYTGTLAQGGSLADVRAALAASPERQGHVTALLTQGFEQQFGIAPTAAVLAVLQTEVARGRSVADTLQVTDLTRWGSSGSDSYGFVVSAAYAADGAGGFVAATFVPTTWVNVADQPALTGASLLPPGPDAITLDVQTLGGAAVRFAVTLDGVPVGVGTAQAAGSNDPGSMQSVDRFTISGTIAPALHHLQLAILDAGAASLRVLGATFDGESFLRAQPVSGSGAQTIDLYPSPGPHPLAGVIDGGYSGTAGMTAVMLPAQPAAVVPAA